MTTRRRYFGELGAEGVSVCEPNARMVAGYGAAEQSQSVIHRRMLGGPGGATTLGYGHIETLPPEILFALQPLLPNSLHQSWRTLAPFDSVRFCRITSLDGG